MLYQRLFAVCENVSGRIDKPAPAIIKRMAISHNELAFHSDVPSKNWKDAELHYRGSIVLFRQLGNAVETANVELNLLTMYWLAGQEEDKKWPKVDAARVKEMTRILGEAVDRRVEMGHKLQEELKRERKQKE